MPDADDDENDDDNEDDDDDYEEEDCYEVVNENYSKGVSEFHKNGKNVVTN